MTNRESSVPGVSRRNFLKAGVATGVAALGASVLPPFAEAADEGTASEAGGRFTPEQLELIGQPHPYTAVSYEPIEGTDPIPPSAPPASWDYEADVIVVGAGGGGLNASLRCAEAGLSVIVIDKLQDAGGVTREGSEFICNVGGSRMQNEMGLPYDPEATVAKWIVADPELDERLCRAAVKGMPECLDWMEDHGVPWEKGKYFFGMNNFVFSWEGAVRATTEENAEIDEFFPRAMSITTAHMHKLGEEAGVDYRFSTQVVALVKDGDRITGVKAVDMDGNEASYHATAGVILTAGGFAGNPKMLQKYCPTVYRGAASSKIPPCDTGEVIRMAWGAGADLAGFDKGDGFDGGIDAYAEGTGQWSRYLYSGDNQLSRQPWLTIDKSGYRCPYVQFVPGDGVYPLEGIYASFGGKTLPHIHQGRIGGRVYVIFDADYETNIFKLQQRGCRIPIRPNMVNIERLPEWLGPHDWRDGVADALERGAIKQADTIEGLADLLGLDEDVLTKAVDDWNAVCERGEDDPEFNYRPQWLLPIAKPPYFGIRIGNQLTQTFCGARINGDMQVIDTYGKVIPGLYAGHSTAGATQTILSAQSGTWTAGYLCAGGLIKDVLGEEAL